MDVLKKTKIELPYDPAIPTPGHILKKKTHDLKEYMHLKVHCRTVYNSKDMEATKMPINGGMGKEDVAHIDD